MKCEKCQRDVKYVRMECRQCGGTWCPLCNGTDDGQPCYKCGGELVLISGV